MVPIDGANPQVTTPVGQPPAWGRTDRNRLLLWVGIALLLPAPFLFVAHLRAGRTSSLDTVQRELPAKAIAVGFVLLATWIVSRMEERPLKDYGIPMRQAFGMRFWEGPVWGFAMLSAILLALRASGHFRMDSVALTGSAVFRFALAWAVTFLAVSWSEEFAFRGYWLFSFCRRMGYWQAALLISVVFGAAHLPNPGENALGILQVIEFGLLMCLILRRTGNLWFAVGFHGAWDWAETYFYGTPNSGLLGAGRFLNSSVHGPTWLTGGSAGPEGSVITLVTLVLCALLIHFRFPRAVYPDRPVECT
ncbi:MAG: type II CAAX endopeptidase family protein [Candidatus Acidiferrales bacterium]